MRGKYKLTKKALNGKRVWVYVLRALFKCMRVLFLVVDVSEEFVVVRKADLLRILRELEELRRLVERSR